MNHDTDPTTGQRRPSIYSEEEMREPLPRWVKVLLALWVVVVVVFIALTAGPP